MRASAVVLISVCSLSLAAGCAQGVAAQVAGPAVASSPPQIVTSATGEAQLTPDRAAIYIGAQTRASTAAVAARDNAERQRAIIDAIVAAGVPRTQISTENYSVTPDTRFDQATQRTSITGYVVSNVVHVDLSRIDQVGAVLDAALAKGANQINSLDFYASNSDSARHQALAQAVLRARADAEAIARASGGSVGSLIDVTSMDTGPRPVFRAMSAAQPGPTPIEPGQQRLQVSVTTRWEFISGRK